MTSSPWLPSPWQNRSEGFFTEWFWCKNEQNWGLCQAASAGGRCTWYSWGLLDAAQPCGFGISEPGMSALPSQLCLAQISTKPTLGDRFRFCSFCHRLIL